MPGSAEPSRAADGPSVQPRRRVPAPGRLVQAADAATLFLFALALYAAVAGPLVLSRYGTLELPPAPVLLLAAVALLGIRHAVIRRPAIAASLAAWREWLHARPHAAAALRAFVFTRPAVFLVAYFAVVTIGFPPRPVGFTLSDDPLGNLPARFDAGWYGGIAQHGYQWDHQLDRQRNIAFFPALPALMRPVGSLIGARIPTLSREERLLRMLWAGVIVSLAAFAWALYYLSRLAQLVAGSRASAYAPLLLAAYPFGVFFNAPYTESLFLLGSVGAFLHFHRQEWIRASAWGLLAGLSRPNGCFLSLALAVLAVQQVMPLATAARWTFWKEWLRPFAVRLLVAAMPGVAMLGFTAYLYQLTGIWLVWARTHGAWGRTWGTGPLEQGWEWLTTEGLMAVLQGVPYDSLNSLAVVFVLLLVWPVFRRMGPAYAVFVLVNLLPPIFAGGALSMGRVTSTLFPVFIVLAVLLPRRSLPGWVAAFAVLQGLVAALFFTWREMF